MIRYLWYWPIWLIKKFSWSSIVKSYANSGYTAEIKHNISVQEMSGSNKRVLKKKKRRSRR